VAYQTQGTYPTEINTVTFESTVRNNYEVGRLNQVELIAEVTNARNGAASLLSKNQAQDTLMAGLAGGAGLSTESGALIPDSGSNYGRNATSLKDWIGDVDHQVRLNELELIATTARAASNYGISSDDLVDWVFDIDTQLKIVSDHEATVAAEGGSIADIGDATTGPLSSKISVSDGLAATVTDDGLGNKTLALSAAELETDISEINQKIEDALAISTFNTFFGA
jgi:hypothetical protein